MHLSKFNTEVVLSTNDLLAVHGVRASEHKKSLNKIVTKGCKLRANVGSAHKGWQLECVKNTSTKTTSTAREEARSKICELIKNGKEKTNMKATFVFSRQILGHHLFFCWVVSESDQRTVH